ncbi:MAG: NAD(P)-binding protein [Candidatus Nitrotoga sp.]
MVNSQTLYEKLKSSLGVFERRTPFSEHMAVPKSEPMPVVIVFGLGRYGGRLMQRLQNQGVNTLGVDFDPEAVRRSLLCGLNARFGDAEDAELPASLPLAEARWALSILHDTGINRALIAALREHGYTGQIAVAAQSEKDIHVLKKAGADPEVSPQSCNAG